MIPYIISRVRLEDKDLTEIGSLTGFTPKLIYTEDKLQPRYNGFFGEMWGDFDWLRSLFPKNASVRCYVTDQKDLDRLKITSHIGMYDLVDNDQIHDFYFALPNTLEKRAQHNSFESNLAWLYVHELLHGKEKFTNGPDRVHAMETQGRLKELLAEHLELEKTLAYKIIFLQRKLIALLRNRHPLLHPLELYSKYITQDYGLKSDHYKKTGRHIGLDYMCPVGSLVRAPYNGHIVQSGEEANLGKYCHYRYLYNGSIYEDRFLHLDEVPIKDSYKRGEIIAFTGNSGDSTGPHLHHEVWRGKVDLETIDKKNWDKLTVDPKIQYITKNRR